MLEVDRPGCASLSKNYWQLVRAVRRVDAMVVGCPEVGPHFRPVAHLDENLPDYFAHRRRLWHAGDDRLDPIALDVRHRVTGTGEHGARAGVVAAGARAEVPDEKTRGLKNMEHKAD